jgi:hypothetical protein
VAGCPPCVMEAVTYGRKKVFVASNGITIPLMLSAALREDWVAVKALLGYGAQADLCRKGLLFESLQSKGASFHRKAMEMLLLRTSSFHDIPTKSIKLFDLILTLSGLLIILSLSSFFTDFGLSLFHSRFGLVLSILSSTAIR